MEVVSSVLPLPSAPYVCTLKRGPPAVADHAMPEPVYVGTVPATVGSAIETPRMPHPSGVVEPPPPLQRSPTLPLGGTIG